MPVVPDVNAWRQIFSLFLSRYLGNPDLSITLVKYNKVHILKEKPSVALSSIPYTSVEARYATEAKNDPKKFIFIGVGILLAIIAIILLVKVARGVGVIMLLVGVGLVIGGLCIQKKVGSREETILKVAFFERISDKCVISIEKKMEDKGEAMTFANEIGIILTKITPHRSDLKQADD